MLSYFGRKGTNSVKGQISNYLSRGIQERINARNYSKGVNEMLRTRINGEIKVNQWQQREYENTIIETQQQMNERDDSINYFTLAQVVNPTNFNQPMTRAIDHSSAKFGEFESTKQFKFNIDSIVYLLSAHDSICGDSDKNKTNFILKKLNSERNLFAKRGRINKESFQCSFNFCAIASTQKAQSSDSFNQVANSKAEVSQAYHKSAHTNTQDKVQPDQYQNQYNLNTGVTDISQNSNININNIINSNKQFLPQSGDKLANKQNMSSETILLVLQEELGSNNNQMNMMKKQENINGNEMIMDQQKMNKGEEGLQDSTRIGAFSVAGAQNQQQDNHEVKQEVNQITQLVIIPKTNYKEKILSNNNVNKVIGEEDPFIHKQQSIASSSITNLTQRDSLCTSSDFNIPPSSPPKASESPLLTSNESSEMSTSACNNTKSPQKKYETASDSIQTESDKNISGKKNNSNQKNNGQVQRSKQRSSTYKIEKKIGDGCSSVVYLAKELDETNNILSNNLIAVKKFKKRKENHFESEQKILSIVNGEHPNIIKIQSINVPQMEIQSDYYPEGNLLDYVIKRGSLTESQARFFFKGIANAILFLKKHNICHRDMKLENVLLDGQFNPVVIDFAFANINKPNFTEFIGTDGYQSPEILLKQPYCGHSSDNFSLGVMLFEMIMGKPPFQQAKLDQGLYKKFTQTNDEYWEAFKKYSNPSEDVKDLINKLLEKDPSQRLSIEEVFQHPWMNESNHPVEQIQE